MAERTLVVGEALVDVVQRPDGSVEEHAGGSPANVAVGLARLGHPVVLASRFGTDRLGEIVRARLEDDEQLTLAAGTQAGEHTSSAVATLDADGSAGYDFDLEWDVDQVLTSALDAARPGHVHTGSIAATLQPGASAVLEAARRVRRTATVSYDPNVRPSVMGHPAQVRSRIEELVGLSDVVKASHEDLAWLYDGAATGEVMQLWGRLGPAVVVVTRSDEGCSVLVPGTGEYAERASYPVEVVDTVGAGDAFMTGLLSGMLDAGLLGSAHARDALREAHLAALDIPLRRALACASMTVARAGADPPTRDELRHGAFRDATGSADASR